MKNVVSILAIAFFGLTTINAQKITFEKETIDYGQIEHKSDGVRSFVITNTGDKPLVIKNVSSTCGCTVPEKPEKPILPGKKGEIKVKYDTNRLGEFSKSISVYSNDPDAARKVLRIRGKVVSK